MIAAGATDAAMAACLGVNRMAVSRHRHNHVLAPAQALVQAAGKGQDVAEQRAQMIAAAEAGDPAAFVALTNIVADLRKVHDRLERSAAAAEQGQQRLAVAALAGQQLRAAEVRAKLGGAGGYAPPKAQAGGERAVFSITINLPGQSERIVVGAGPAIAGAALPDEPPDADLMHYLEGAE